MSQNPLLEVELYAFASNSAQFYLTPHEFDVDIDGNLYKSLALERNELALGAEAAKAGLDLKLPPNCDLVRHLLANSLTGDTTSITLRIGRRDTWGDYWWISGTRWMGRVLGVEVADDVARVRCESAQVSLKRIGLRRLYSRKCSHVLYSAACGASPISSSAFVSNSYGRNVDLDGGVPSSVSGGLAGGWLQTPEGARHMIVNDYGGGVELLYPVAIDVGTEVLLTVGCDHSTATCESRFGTIDVLAGGAGQGRNDYLMSRLGSSIPAFRGVLSLVARKILFAANNPYIKPWAVRVRRFTAGWFDAPWMEWNAEVRTWDEDEGQEISVGMNPAHILVQCLTDPHWGMGYPQSTIGWSFWNAAWALSSEGFGLNLIWTRQQPIESFIGQVIDHIGGILYTDPEQGTFDLKLLRDDYWIDSLPQLGPDEIVRLERFERAQWGELPNELTVVYTDWQTGGDATVTVENLAAIQLQGGVINQRRDYPGVNYGPLAARLALRDLRALGSPLARMSLTVARDTLERAPLPGDVFLLNWPRLGVDQMVVRVTGIDTGVLGSAEWRIEAMEDVFGMSNTVLSPPPPHVEEPTIEPLPPALVLAVEVPYWELARRLSRADLAYLTDTDTYLGALAAAGGTGQLNWQLATGTSGGDLTSVVGEDYAPLLMLDAALPASEVDAIGVPVTAISQPERLAEGDYAYLVDASGAIAEAVTVLAFDAANATIDLARGVLDTTPQAHALGTRLIGVGEWLASEGAERAPGESVFVGAIPRTSTDQGDAVLAANGQPMVLAGRQALPYPPGRIRLNGQTEPAVVAGDITVTWAHRDRTQQTAYLVQQDEGDIGPELGVTYTLRIRNRNDVLAHTETGLLGTTFIWTAAVAALDAGALGDRITVEISAERDGLSSWQPQVRVMDRAGYGLRWGQYWGGV